MQIATYFGSLDTAPTVKSDAADALISAVGKFESRIRKINLTVRDVNGPKGGDDLCCRCVVHLKRMAPIVIEENGANLRNTLNRITDRVSYTLSQKMDRAKKSSRPRKSRERADSLVGPSPAG